VQGRGCHIADPWRVSPLSAAHRGAPFLLGGFRFGWVSPTNCRASRCSLPAGWVPVRVGQPHELPRITVLLPAGICCAIPQPVVYDRSQAGTPGAAKCRKCHLGRDLILYRRDQSRRDFVRNVR
jgi:hypothetical protein